MNTTLSPILVVEDDEIFLNALSTELRGAGWDVLGASSVEEACRILRLERVSLVLLDWNLNNAGGVSTGSFPSDGATGNVVLKVCRDVNPLIPVIVMSGERAFDVRTDAVLNEADSYLEKPFSMSLLVGHVSRWLKRCDATQKSGPTPTDQDNHSPSEGPTISSLLDS